MSSHGVVVSDVWKKFHRGEVHDSLRDLIPAVARKLKGKGSKRSELGEGDFWALRELSLEVRAGEALGIIGPNGAGKSTTLKILSGIMRPDRGSVTVRGRLRALIEVAAGFHPDLTGRENIFLNGAILGMPADEVAGKLDQIVDFSGIEPFLETPVKRYSSGMMARLGFSVAAHMDPDVLLVDEILSVGDLAFQKKCYAYMASLAERGVAVIFISHNMASITRLCPRTLVLDGGTVRFVGDTDEAQQAYFALLEDRATGDDTDGPALEQVEVRDDVGREKRVFRSGDACRIRATVLTRRPHPEFSLGLSLARPSGDEVFHTTASRLHDQSLAAAEGDLIELEADLDLNLAGGSYTLYVQCHDYANTPSEINRFSAGEIHVEPTPRYGGIAFLNPVVELRKASSSVASNP